MSFSFLRSSGPGGQNVNKVATAVQLRFDLMNESGLNEEIKLRLGKIARKRISSDGILIIEAKRYRTQEKNKQDAISRLIKLIKKAAEKSNPRKKTRPTLASNEKRVEVKKKRGALKKARKKFINTEE